MCGCLGLKQTKKLETEGTPSALFFIKRLCYDCCCVLTVFHLYDPQMSIAKHASMDSINLEFGNKEKVES